MRFLFLAFSLSIFLACKSHEDSSLSKPLNKSTSSFVVDIEYTVETENLNYHYYYQAFAKEQSPLRKISAIWKVPDQVQIVSEASPRFESGVWVTTLEILSTVPNPQVLIEFTGEAENTPLGASRLVRYGYDEKAKKIGKGGTFSSKPESLFPDRTHF